MKDKNVKIYGQELYMEVQPMFIQQNLFYKYAVAL